MQLPYKNVTWCNTYDFSMKNGLQDNKCGCVVSKQKHDLIFQVT